MATPDSGCFGKGYGLSKSVSKSKIYTTTRYLESTERGSATYNPQPETRYQKSRSYTSDFEPDSDFDNPQPSTYNPQPSTFNQKLSALRMFLPAMNSVSNQPLLSQNIRRSAKHSQDFSIQSVLIRW